MNQYRERSYLWSNICFVHLDILKAAQKLILFIHKHPQVFWLCKYKGQPITTPHLKQVQLICFPAKDFLSLYCSTHKFSCSCNPSFIIGVLTGVLRWRTDNSLRLSRLGSHNERSRCSGESSACREGNYSIQAIFCQFSIREMMKRH